MNLVNIVCTSAQVRNFGLGNCTTQFGWWRGNIAIPKGTRLTAEQLEALKATLIAKVTADNFDERFHLIGPFHTVERNYQDQNVQTRGDGSTAVTREATAGWRATMDKGGVCLSRALQSLNNLQDTYDFMTITSKNALLGTRHWNSTTSAWEFGGYDLSMLNVPTPNVGVPEEVDGYLLEWQLANKDQMFKDGMIVGFDFDIFSTLTGVIDVELTQLTAIDGSGVVTVGAAAGCGATNLATSAQASTWANVARWSATNNATGNAITISGVSVAANGSGFSVDLDSADADYPPSGGLIALTLQSVSTLSSAGLKYYAPYAENPDQGVNGTELLIKVP